MTFIPGIRRLLRLGGVRDVESAVDDELGFHFDMAVRELMAGGMREDEARREAERRFGDVGAARARLASLDRERVNSERRADWWSALGQDLRYALRGLRLKPGFTLGVVLTLGLGIGANATMFGIVDRLMFRPPAYMRDAGRVQWVHFSTIRRGAERSFPGASYVRFRDMQRFSRDFEVVAATLAWPLAIGLGEGTAEVVVHAVSADFWRLFDMRPVLGRFFTAGEDAVPEPARVAVLGYGYWQSRFGGSPGVLGQSLRIGRNDYTIVGVAPRGYHGAGLRVPAITIPITAMLTSELPSIFSSEMSGSLIVTSYVADVASVIVRRKAGVGIPRATSDLSAAFRRSYERQAAEQSWVEPGATARPRVVLAPVQWARGPNRSDSAQVTVWLVGVAAIVLLIACANVANLLLGRAFGRRREIAVRLALGVSRSRLLAQLLVESVVLAFAGCAAGLLVGQWGGVALRALLLPSDAWTVTLADTRTLAVCATLALLVAVVTGLLPAGFAWRADVTSALKTGAGGGGVHRSRPRAAMLVVQLALAVVLLVGAGLFVQSLWHARAVPTGFDEERVFYVATELRGVSLPRSQLDELQRQLLERVRTVPGVESAARAVTQPFGFIWELALFVDGIDSVGGLGRFEAQGVSPGYFATMGTRLLRGRGIEVQDRHGAPAVIVVSQSMARRLWPTGDALGKCVRLGAATAPCTTVVGVAEDIRFEGPSSGPTLSYYLSVEQYDGFEEGLLGGLLVRGGSGVDGTAEAVRRTLQSLMPAATYVTVTPLRDQVAEFNRPWRLGAAAFTVFGVLALLVATVGLYSVVSYGVAQRSQELAVRTALGAQARDIVRMVVGEGLRTLVVATGLGLAAAWLAARWVGPLLFQTSPRDPAIYGGVAVVLVVVALVASAIPAVRASRADPIAALRAE